MKSMEIAGLGMSAMVALAGCGSPPAMSTDDSGGTGLDGGAGTADWGFRPMPNGFAFENYTNAAMPTNLTGEEMRRLFGPQVCEGMAATGTCNVVPQARQWMEHQNGVMNGGHCEGFAVLASLMYSGVVPPSMFGGTDAYSLTMNDAMTREIALWFVTQTTVANEDRTLTPSQVVDRLAADMSRGTSFQGTVVGIYRRGGGGGHAITPYAVRRPTPTTAEIVVYDNNYPNAERVVMVDTAANTWTYTASTNPTEMGALYDGDATTFNLTLADIGSRVMLPHACAFCGNLAMDGGGRGSRVMLQAVGEGDVRIDDGLGHTTGTDTDGSTVNTIPDADVTSERSASLFQDSPEPTYTLPHDQPLSVTLDGSRLTAASPTEMTITGAGFAVQIDGIDLAPMEIDTIDVQPGLPDVAYHAAGTQTPTLALAFQQAGDDYLVEARSMAMTAGQGVRISVDLASSTVALSFDGSASAPEFTLYMERVSETGTVVFQHTGVAASVDAVLYVEYAAWGGDTMPLSVDFDDDGDGTIDHTDSLTDEP